MPQRHGFTLVEVIVALTLIGVGVTAWMATAALGVAVAADAERATRGAFRARNRAEQVASLPCASIVAGSNATESWTVEQHTNGMRLVRAQSPYGSGVRAGVASYAVLVAC